MAEDLSALPTDERLKRIRELAKQALDKADQTNDLAAKETYIGIAYRWERLARELED